MGKTGWTKCLGCGRVLPENVPDCPHCGRRVTNRRDPDDRRFDEDRRQQQVPFEGPDRRTNKDRRRRKDRRSFSY